MKDLFKRIVFFLVPILTLLIAIYFLFGSLDKKVTSILKKTKMDEYYVWNQIDSCKINSEIIIFGASRAWLHIDPAIIEDSLGLSAYNLGLDGYAFDMQKCKWDFYVNRNKLPKVVIFSLDYFTLTKNNGLLNINQFLPYIDDTIIYNKTKNYQGLSWCDYHLPFVRYIDHFQSISDAVLSSRFPDSNISKKRNGFWGNPRTWNDDLKNAINKLNCIDSEIDSATVSNFDIFVADLLNKNIKVVFVYSPEYIEGHKIIKNRIEVFKIYTKIADKYKIKFFDYSYDSMSYDISNFYNANHLNNKGANYFTRKFVSDIKNRALKL